MLYVRDGRQRFAYLALQEMISAEFANLKGWRTLAAQSNFRRMLKKGRALGG